MKPRSVVYFMSRLLFQLIFCLLVCSLFACADIKKSLKTTTPEPQVRAQSPDPLVPEIKDVAYVIKLDGAGAVEDISLQKGDDTEPVSDQELKKRLLDGTSQNNSSNANAPADAVVIIEPTGTDKFDAIAQIIRGARRAFTSRIKVRVSDGVYAFVRTDWGNQIPSGLAKPDPLTLILEVDTAGNLFINKDPRGSLSKPILLRELLDRVFQSRAENGIFRPGTDILERTVLVKLPPSMTWKDATALIRVVRETGADPIGLLVENLEK